MEQQDSIKILNIFIKKYSLINLFHFIFVFSLLFYIGYENGVNEEPINKDFAKFIIALACFIFLYHLYLFLKKNNYFKT